jgi:hypothetical protein
MAMPAISPTDQDVTHENGLDLSLEASQFLIDRPVCVKAGPLAGLRGVTHNQAHDGRWIIKLDDVEPGVYLCVECQVLTYE